MNHGLRRSIEAMTAGEVMKNKVGDGACLYIYIASTVNSSRNEDKDEDVRAVCRPDDGFIAVLKSWAGPGNPRYNWRSHLKDCRIRAYSPHMEESCLPVCWKPF